MAGRNGGRVSRTLQVLIEMRDELKEIRGELREVRQSVDQLNLRFDNFLLGPHRDEHQALKQRVERLEAHVGIKG